MIYYIVRFDVKKPKTLPDGRVVSLPERSFYAGKNKKEVAGPHQAAYLNKEIADAVATFYPEKAPKVIEENNYLADHELDSIHTTLASVGESITASELESTVRAALRSLTKKEVDAAVKRAFA